MMGQCDDVHVTLDDENALELSQRLAHFEQAVEFAAFVKHRCFRRIQIFGFAVIDDPSAETDDAPAAVADREHDAIAEPVVASRLLVFDNQPGFEQALAKFVAAAKFFQHGIPTAGRIADQIAFGCVSIQTARLEVIDRARMIPQALAEKQRHFAQQFVQRRAGRRRRARRLVPRHLHTVQRCQFLHGVDEFEVIVFHQKTERCAMRTAAEAVIKALVRADRKRRGFFVMKRTAGLVLPAGFLELYAAADELDDVGTVDQLVDEFLRDATGHIGLYGNSCCLFVRSSNQNKPPRGWSPSPPANRRTERTVRATYRSACRRLVSAAASDRQAGFHQGAERGHVGPPLGPGSDLGHDFAHVLHAGRAGGVDDFVDQGCACGFAQRFRQVGLEDFSFVLLLLRKFAAAGIGELGGRFAALLDLFLDNLHDFGFFEVTALVDLALLDCR